MEYTRLGTSGLKISRIALGCMSFGDPTKRTTWALDDNAAEPIFRQAVELGITFWDTANIYSLGTSEEIVGRALRKYTQREDIVLATKLWAPMHQGPGGAGLSRRGHHGADRRLTAAPGHRLRRPLPDPPLRPAHAGRGNDAGTARCGQGRQGPLHRARFCHTVSRSSAT